ncbi:hypothetical protein H4R21_002506 [Coemansia helicoidea]|uniref:Uncharacterized protein n=1 Tax=Coemansia helicoidea TaxID=1286919 RepID=A0ACC1L7V9_9FUNG|nr:hypothetical protein H4R21_002506 [Coemansia helicoidea]
MTLSVEGPIETGVYDVASVGASYVVEHQGLFGPLINAVPGAQPILAAAHLLGGRFAGSTAGGIAGRAVRGFIEGDAGNSLPAASAGAAASSAISGLVSAVTSLDQFKPIIHPDVVSTIDTIESLGGLISSLVGWAVKVAVRYFYTSNLLNDTPYVGELIRNADSLIKPEYRAPLDSLAAELAPTLAGGPLI